MVGNTADSPWQPLPALGSPCHPWQPLPAFSKPWQLCQSLAATANPWQPLPALGSPWMGDAWGEEGECFNKKQDTIAIRKGHACNLQRMPCNLHRKEKRDLDCKRKLCKKQPACKLQTTRLQFADDALALCRRHACNLQTTRVHLCKRTWGERLG